MAETIEAFEMHEQPDFTYSVQGDRITFTENYGGGAQSLGATGASYRVGDEWSDVVGDLLPADAEGVVTTGVSFDRKVGSLGHLAVSYSIILKREIWNVEWQEVSKDIRTWISSANCPNMVTGATAAKQLAYLAGWESLRDAKDWDNFADYKYPITSTGGEAYISYSVLPEPVLTVAHKIMKGVQSYSIFAPVVTRTTTHAFYPPASGNLGKKNTPVSGLDGWTSFNNETLDFSALANEWLKNVERSSSNGDGTFTLVEGWLGVDEVDGDLYQSAGTGA